MSCCLITLIAALVLLPSRDAEAAVEMRAAILEELEASTTDEPVGGDAKRDEVDSRVTLAVAEVRNSPLFDCSGCSSCALIRVMAEPMCA